MLECLRAAVIEATGRLWPETPAHQAAPVDAQLIDDRYNPMLRLGHGDPQSPVATPVEHDIHLDMVIDGG
jgi:hypothetical protein